MTHPPEVATESAVPVSLVKREEAAGVSFETLQRMAKAVVASQLFGIKTIEQAVALMLVAQAEGRHPALAARDYDIIQGRPAKKAEAMHRDFVAAGGMVTWHRLDDTMADASFSHPQSPNPVRITWDMDRVRKAGIANKDMYAKYPRQMLRSRCISEGVRTVYPMATSGMYVPEEAHDIATAERKKRDPKPLVPPLIPVVTQDEEIRAQDAVLAAAEESPRSGGR